MVDGVSVGDEQQLVEHVEHLARWLVDRRDDRPPRLQPSRVELDHTRVKMVVVVGCRWLYLRANESYVLLPSTVPWRGAGVGDADAEERREAAAAARVARVIETWRRQRTKILFTTSDSLYVQEHQQQEVCCLEFLNLKAYRIDGSPG